jgi:hypothetical protein
VISAPRSFAIDRNSGARESSFLLMNSVQPVKIEWVPAPIAGGQLAMFVDVGFKPLLACSTVYLTRSRISKWQMEMYGLNYRTMLRYRLLRLHLILLPRTNRRSLLECPIPLL